MIKIINLISRRIKEGDHRKTIPSLRGASQSILSLRGASQSSLSLRAKRGNLVLFLACLAFLACTARPAFPANKMWWATCIAGGTSGCLDAIDGDNLTDGDGAFVIRDNASSYEGYLYRLEDYSSAPPSESSPDTITPDTNPGNKRWKLVKFYASDLVLSTSVNFKALLGLVEKYDTWTNGQLLCARTTDGKNEAETCGAKTTYTEPGTNIPICRTGSTTTGGCTNITDVAYVAQSAVPWQRDVHVPAPAATDVIRFRTTKAITLSAIGCIVDPADSGESVVVDVQECNGDGDSCSTVITGTLTCGNTNTTATIGDTSLAANVWILIDLGTVTGTVSDLSIYLKGTEAQ